MNYIMKIIKSLEKYGLLIKSISESIRNEAKEQKGGFFGVLLGPLWAILLGDLLRGKYTIRGDRGTIRAGYNFQCQFIL